MRYKEFKKHKTTKNVDETSPILPVNPVYKSPPTKTNPKQEPYVPDEEKKEKDKKDDEEGIHYIA